MKKNLLFLLAISLTAILFNACEKENAGENLTPDVDAVNLKKTANQIIDKLSDSTTIGGLELMDRAEYERLPEFNVTDFPSLTSNVAELRSSRVVLPVPPVWNQGTESCCVSFAVGYIGVSYYLNRLKRLPYATNGAYRSPEFLYNNTKIGSDCSGGSMFVNVLNFLRNYGVCSWSEMPYSYNNGCSNRGNSTQWVQARVGMIKSWSTVPNNVYTMRDLLDRGYPILMGFTLDESFMVQTDAYPYTYTRKGGASKGGHAVAIIGYDDSRQVFIVQNSWGKGKHDSGIFYVSYALMPQLRPELYVIDPV